MPEGWTLTENDVRVIEGGDQGGLCSVCLGSGEVYINDPRQDGPEVRPCPRGCKKGGGHAPIKP